MYKNITRERNNRGKCTRKGWKDRKVKKVCRASEKGGKYFAKRKCFDGDFHIV